MGAESSTQRRPFDIAAERAPVKRARWTKFHADTVTKAVGQIIPYLEDTSEANQAIYFDGWSGVAASAILRDIAEDPPPSLRKTFDRIVHVDCSRWKNRRALQKQIALQLELPQQIMAIFDRQDLEDDFNGVDEGSRIEIGEVGTTIHQALQGNRCLVVFHNGSNSKVDLNDFGIPQDRWSSVKVLWTFRGRLRPNPKMKQKMEPEIHNSRVESIYPNYQAIVEGVDNSQVYLHSYFYDSDDSKLYWTDVLQAEAREIVQYTRNPAVSPDIATKCCLYLLWLNSKDGDIMEYNWGTHASNYWVCDGIIQQGEEDKAWEVGVALHQEIRLDDYSSNKLPDFGDELNTPPNRWVTYSNEQQRRTELIVPPESTSFFLAFKSGSDHMIASLPNNIFQHSKKLNVLKLSNCSFNFSSPPFRFCRCLRFLGLNLCKDQPQKEENQDRPEMAFFESMWVLDICNTDWELTLSSKITEKMATNIREVNIKRGRIWSNNFAWGRLRNLRKLRVIEPTHPWDHKEEFKDMVKLELLDLSGNITIQVFPTLSGATGLKTLVLDGCVGLEHVGPEGLPPALESFSLYAGLREDNNKEAKISHISMAGCARLANFILRGSLPKLEELDISGTSVKTLDLKDEVVQVPCLRRVILLGCELLLTILWPEKGMQQLRVLCIDTRGREEVRKISPNSLVHPAWREYCHAHAYVAIMDMKFVRLLVLRHDKQFCWNTCRFNLNLCISSASRDNLDKGQSCNKEKITYSTGQIIGPLLHKSLIPGTYCSYTDVTIDKITADKHDSSTLQFQQVDCQVEIGAGFINTNVESAQGIKAIIFVMNKVELLHVHDNSLITTVIPERMMSIGSEQIGWRHLKQCRVERCPKLHTVFTTDYDIICFEQLETFWAADLLMAHCIWSEGRVVKSENTRSFATLRSIHLYSCPRLVFVLPLLWAAPYSYFPNLETLHVVGCGDLRQVFPVEPGFLNIIATDHRKGILEFPKLKHIDLHELPKLQQICEAKMSTPMLETIRLRGCWSLKRLPAVDHHCRDSRPIVDCEKDWWDKLDWDGPHVGHDPSLFDLHPSQYYKRPQPRGSVLR